MPRPKSKKGDDKDDNDDVPIESIEQSYLHPKQPADERRVIRRQYRQLIEGLQRDKHDLINPSSDSLNERLVEVDELFPQVQEGPEAALDSHALALVANLGRQRAQALNTAFVKFDTNQFAEKLVTFMGGRLDNDNQISAAGWVRLGEAVQPFFRRAPTFHYLAGSFERGEVNFVRKVAQNKTKDKEGEDQNTRTKPEVRGGFPKADEGDGKEATTAEVEKVEKILWQSYRKAEGFPICYFEFVVNPESFGQTVENIFYTSFLVRENRARIYLDDDGLPVIEPVKSDEKDGKAAKKEKNHQAIISITPNQWKEIKQTFEIDDVPIIPTRVVRHKDQEYVNMDSS